MAATHCGDGKRAVLAERGLARPCLKNPGHCRLAAYPQDKVALVITSTTGQGDLEQALRTLLSRHYTVGSANLRYGVIALGDAATPIL